MPDLRIREIDESHLEHHFYLDESDECYFLHEYTSHKDFTYSDVNSLIKNLKKSPQKKGKREWFYKERDMNRCALSLQRALNHEWLKQTTLVPMPGSKAADHPEYDPRILTICQRMQNGLDFELDVRELLKSKQSVESAIEREVSGQHRAPLDELKNNFEIDDELAAEAPFSIGLVDDVLTAGTHFRAASELLTERFPGIRIVGVFIARRTFPPPEEP